MAEENNYFLTRGCCRVPEADHHTTDIYKHSCNKLDSFNWLKDIQSPDRYNPFDIVEVRFKNSRKEFFRYPVEYTIIEGDIVAVESSPGHDIGIVSMTGELVKLQMRKKKVPIDSPNIKKVYRKARTSDIEKWVSSVQLEEKAKYRTREIASSLNLNMKINDVEYQGDRTKAIFYYTAEDRVDFRELIKKLAEEFKIRIEMRQIGARQEASRLGGTGSCGRELCCSTWLTDFRSVSTNAARAQQLSLNPQKLAGQCGKLKCCLNYEYDHYHDALRKFPDSNIPLKTKKGDAYHQKSDIFKKVMWYAYQEESNMLAIPIEKVDMVQKMNKKGKIPANIEDFAETKEEKTAYENAIDQNELTRFDED